MGARGSTFLHRAYWLGCVPLLPVLAFQGWRLRGRILRLPEAEGPCAGELGAGARPPIRLALLGESTVAGVGVEHQGQGLAVAAARALAQATCAPVRWQAVGMSGATMVSARELVARLQLPLDAVAVVVGVNDTIRLTTTSAWMSAAQALAAQLRGLGVTKVIFSSVPPMGSFAALPQPLRGVLGVRARLLDALLQKALSSGEGTQYCRVTFPEGRHLMARDGFHPSEAGYTEWGRQLALGLIQS